ncbi:hypothetical protein Tco_0552563, partial [Tanacetum coccineum]
LQKLVSRLAILGVDTSPEDLNVKCRIPRSFHGLSTRSMAQKIKH